jgi:hypothetical protein
MQIVGLLLAFFSGIVTTLVVAILGLQNLLEPIPSILQALLGEN